MEEFKVGDFVVSRLELEAFRLSSNSAGTPTLMQVTAAMRESFGGTIYRCRTARYGSLAGGTADFWHVELAPAPTVPVKEG